MKKFFAILMVVVIAVSLCACGSSAMSTSDKYAPSLPAEAPMAPMYGGGMAATESAADDAFYEEYYEPSDMGASASNAQPELENIFPEGTKMVYTANIEMQTTEFDKAIENLKVFVNQNKGYFESSSVNTSGSYRYGYYTVRVPAENYRAFVENAGSDCLRTYFSEDAQDISEVYYDTQSRLETQRTKLDRLQSLLEQAENMEDIITLESAISETEWMIERLSGSMRHYDSMVGYSTVQIEVREVYKLANVEEPVIGFGAKLASAFKRGCENFVDGVQDLILAIAYGWVTILIMLVIVAVIVVICLRHSRKKKKLMAQRIAEYEKMKAAEEKND